jgi:hypothetical protein
LYEWPGKTIGQSRPNQSQSEHSQNNERGNPAISVGTHNPTAGGGGNRGEYRECESHASQKRETTFSKRLIHSCEYKWENRQNARTDNCQNAAQKCNYEQYHGVVVVGTKSSIPMMMPERFRRNS